LILVLVGWDVKCCLDIFVLVVGCPADCGCLVLVVAGFRSYCWLTGTGLMLLVADAGEVDVVAG
jgi:hypothetical protein